MRSKFFIVFLSIVVFALTSAYGQGVPVLNSIGNKNTKVGYAVNLSLSGTGENLRYGIYTNRIPGPPAGYSLVNNGDGTASFSWTPDETQFGFYEFLFFVKDTVSGNTDQEIVTFDVDREPVLSPIGSKTTTQGHNLNFVIDAVDDDGDSLVFSAARLPDGATLTDNGNGTAVFNWTPGFQKNQYNVFVTFYVKDLFTLFDNKQVVDSEVVEISVNIDENKPPVLDPIGVKGASAGSTLNFTISATDPNTTIPYFTASGLPTGATFVDNNNGTATFNWNTTTNSVGTYSVTFYASDGSFVDYETVQITITDPVNEAPAFDYIMAGGVKYTNNISLSLTEGTNFQFTAYFIDPEGKKLFLSADQLPPRSTYVDKGNGTGLFDWTPSYTQRGYYEIVLNCSDGALTTQKTIVLNVADAGNQPPVFKPVTSKSVMEGNTLTFYITASDPEGSSVSFPSSGTGFSMPSGMTKTNFGKDSALVSWTPTYCQAGTYTANFIASDGIATSTLAVTINVLNDVNNPPLPILNPIGSKSVEENRVLQFTISATIPYGCEIPSLGVDPNTKPAGDVTFTDNRNGTGTFYWKPNFNQAGTYHVKFFADLGLSNTYFNLPADSEVVTITVWEASNQPPTITGLTDKSKFVKKVGDNIQYNLKATDPEGNPIKFTITGKPANATFVDNGNGTAVFDYIPADSGTYNIVFNASDGLVKSSISIDLKVLKGFGIISLNGVKGLVGTSTDVIGSCQLVTFYINVENNAGIDIPTWTNAFRVYSPDDTAMNWVRTSIFTVDTANYNPSLNQITFPPTNPNGKKADTVRYEGIKPFPQGYNDTLVAITIGPLKQSDIGKRLILDLATKSGTVNTWEWRLDPFQKFAPVWNGPYTFTIADNPGFTNTPPTIDLAVTNYTVNLCSKLTFTFGIADPDGLPGFGSTNLPSGATLTDNPSAGTVTFSWIPVKKQAGTFNFKIFANDGCATSEKDIAVTVTNPSEPEIIHLDTIVDAFDDTTIYTLTDDTLIATCQKVNLRFSGVELIDSGRVVFSLGPNAPQGASIQKTKKDANNIYYADFSWEPTATQLGVYSFYVHLTDQDCFSVDSEKVTITVMQNQPPAFSILIPDDTVRACDSMIIDLPASDPEGFSLTYSYRTVDGTPFPGGTNLIKDGKFTWVPTYTDVKTGGYELVFRVKDNCGNVDSQFVKLFVTPNTKPTLSLIEVTLGTVVDTLVKGDTVFTVEDSIIFNLKGTDPQGDDLFFDLKSKSKLSPDSFIDNMNGTATLTLVPEMKGVYRLFFIVSDGCSADTSLVTVFYNYNLPQGVHLVDGDLPDRFDLNQNFPNPFNPMTIIEFQIPTASDVRLDIFNVLGQRVKTLIDTRLSRNRYQVEWDGSNDQGTKVSSGVYFYRIHTEQYVNTKKMLMLK